MRNLIKRFVSYLKATTEVEVSEWTSNNGNHIAQIQPTVGDEFYGFVLEFYTNRRREKSVSIEMNTCRWNNEDLALMPIQEVMTSEWPQIEQKLDQWVKEVRIPRCGICNDKQVEQFDTLMQTGACSDAHYEELVNELYEHEYYQMQPTLITK